MTQSPGGTGSDSSDDDQRGQSAEPGPELPTVTQWWSADSVAPPHPPTEVDAPHSPTEVDAPHPPTETGGFGPRTPDAPLRDQTGLALGRTVSAVGPTGIVRRGPGVPVSSPAGQAGPTAGQVWRTGQPPAPPRRRRRLRRSASGALTVVLLAAAGVVLYLRFHHAPLRVTSVAITRQVTNGCAVDVTGRITTNGSAGTVSYQWLFQPQSGAPQPMSQSVLAGQDAVYVTVAVEGQGRGSATRDVTLQVLGPGVGTASVHLVVSC